MPLFDLSPDQLVDYRPDRDEPTDFDAFWAETLDDARRKAAPPKFERVHSGLKTLDVYDVTFSGYGGQSVKGWYIEPVGTNGKLPAVVEFLGYGGGRNLPLSYLVWPSAGYAFMVMDTRGQGSAWSFGDTPDLPDGANPFFPGFMTQGILDPQTYYYRRVYADAVRAVETMRDHAHVDPARIAVTGGSQGGGLSIAAAGLVPDAVSVCMPDVPFLCHFRRAVEITPDAPYTEISRYLSVHRGHIDRVFETLSYFDGMNLAARCKADCLYSVALMDTICPPSTIYAAYNQVTARKEIRQYKFNNHEGGGILQTQSKLDYLNAKFFPA